MDISTGLHDSLEERFERMIGQVRKLVLTSPDAFRFATDVVLQIASDLEAIGLDALKADYPGVFDYVVSLLNLLADVTSHGAGLPEDIVEEFLNHLILDPAGSFLRAEKVSPLVLQGKHIHSVGTAMGVGVINLVKLHKYYCIDLGLPENPSGKAALWEKAMRGELTLDSSHLYLDGRAHCVWFADETTLYLEHGVEPENGVLDANLVYDLLALDWRDPSDWDGYGTDECETKALMIRSPLAARKAAERGLRVPTGIDAWGHPLWLPRTEDSHLPWPDGGGRTLNLRNGNSGVPEGVHGPLDYTSMPGEEPVVAIGTVTGWERSQRTAVYGAKVCEDAANRLRNVAVSGG